jgi:uncharacterized protein YutE (UPF0331/DUF86 family)
MINGVSARKRQTLDQVLAELRSLGWVDTDQLRGNWQIRRAVERELQILIEIVADVCQRIVSLSGQAPATTGADAVACCLQLGALSDDDVYRQMVRFRHFFVHRYEQIEVGILATAPNRRLPDFERFSDEILHDASRIAGAHD